RKLPARTVAGLKRLARTATSRKKVAQKLPSWPSLVQYAGTDRTQSVRQLVRQGMLCRRASKILNLPLALAWETRDLIYKMPVTASFRMWSALKEAEALHPKDAICSKLIRTYGYDNVRKASLALQAFRDGELPLQKVAVDQTTKDY